MCSSRRTTRTACLLALALAIGCAPASPAAPPPNLLLIVVDTLRADRLGCYGNRRELTPFLDELAARSTVFTRAYAQSSWTEPSVASLFTSRFPSQHGASSWHSSLSPENRTVAEVLHAHGYDTAAWVANLLINPFRGYGRGFTYFQTGQTTNLFGYDNLPLQARAEELTDDAMAWLMGRAEKVRKAGPAFLYFHFMEVHYPFVPPAEVLARVSRGRTVDVERVNALYYFDPEGFSVEDIEDVYDAEVATLDAALRRMFEALAELHFLDRAVVVVTADHGEEFDEHGGRSHGKTLYEELIRVPLLVHRPGQTDRRDVDDVVSLVDVAPTLLDLAGIPSPRAFEGRSLQPLMMTGGAWSRLLAGLNREKSPPAFSELLPKTEGDQVRHDRAVVRGSHKLLMSPAGKVEVFDLASDPGETRPIGAGPVRQDLEAPLLHLMSRIRTVPEGPPVEPVKIDEKTRERLKALGYAG